MHEQETRNLKLEIDYLCKKLHRKEHDRRDPTPPSSEGSDEGTEPIDEGQGHPLANLSPHHHALIS